MAQFPFTQAEYQRLHDALFQAYLEAQANAAVCAKDGLSSLAEHSYKRSEECLALADLVSLKMSAERQAESCVWYTAEEWYNAFKEDYDNRKRQRKSA